MDWGAVKRAVAVRWCDGDISKWPLLRPPTESRRMGATAPPVVVGTRDVGTRCAIVHRNWCPGSLRLRLRRRLSRLPIGEVMRGHRACYHRGTWTGLPRARWAVKSGHAVTRRVAGIASGASGVRRACHVDDPVGHVRLHELSDESQ